MMLFYVDESGGTSVPQGRRTRHSSLFSLAAVGIHDSARASLASDLVELRQQTFGEKAASNWAQTEIKARYLWQVHESIRGKAQPHLPAPYVMLADPQKFNAFLHSVEKLFSKFRPTIFAAIVDKSRLRGADRDFHTIGQAYAALYQNVALTMENVYGGTSAAFVADQQDEHERFFASGRMGSERDDRASRGKYRPNFNLLLDKPLWIDANLSIWDREIIQLADLAAFATRAWAAAGKPPAERHFLWRAIEPFLASDWRKGTGIRGFGLTIIPDPGPDFPAL